VLAEPGVAIVGAGSAAAACSTTWASRVFAVPAGRTPAGTGGTSSLNLREVAVVAVTASLPAQRLARL